VTRGYYTEALSLAERAIVAAPDSAWPRYQRAVALHHLGRTDSAVSDYLEAEARFGGRDRWGKAISIYGRARAFADIGRCNEASAAYNEYAAFVGSFDPPSASLAARLRSRLQSGQTPLVDPAMTALGSALIKGQYADALKLAGSAGDAARASGGSTTIAPSRLAESPERTSHRGLPRCRANDWGEPTRTARRSRFMDALALFTTPAVAPKQADLRRNTASSYAARIRAMPRWRR